MELKLTEQAKEARRRYAKMWREQHPDNIKASQERYWERKAKKAAEAAAAANAKAE